MVIIIYVNDFELTSDKKLEYGLAMIGFSGAALLLISVWMIWQFLIFLYDFKFVRDIVQETKVANKVHPEDDNLKIELQREYNQDEMISHISGLSESQDSDEQARSQNTIVGIQNNYEAVIHYDEKPNTLKLPVPRNESRAISDNATSDYGQEPRLISSRNSSRMLFADIDI